MSNKLYVGNLSFNVRSEILEQTFAEFGQVSSAKVIVDRETNRSKGFGFVEMSTNHEAAAAIAGLNATELDGRAMSVSEAKPMAERSNSRY